MQIALITLYHKMKNGIWWFRQNRIEATSWQSWTRVWFYDDFISRYDAYPSAAKVHAMWWRYQVSAADIILVQKVATAWEWFWIISLTQPGTWWTIQNASVRMQDNAFVFWQGKERYCYSKVRFPQLLTSTQDASIRIGFLNTITLWAAACFYFNRWAWTSVWKTVTNATGTTTTTTDSTIAIDTRYELEIFVNSDASKADFYVDWVLVATHTTNIPKTLAQATSFGFTNRNEAGSSAKTVSLDNFFVL